MSPFAQKVLQYGMLILVINALGLWGMVWAQQQRLATLLDGTEQEELVVPVNESISDRNSKNNQLQKIEMRVNTLEDSQLDVESRLEELDEQLQSIDPNAETTPTPVSSTQQLEQIVYLGAGSSNNLEWTTIPGTTVTINTSNYPSLSEVYFEAGLSIVGGDASARLINTTDNTVVYSSSVVHNSNTVTWKKSKMNLDEGENSYAVQLRSSSSEQVTLSGARLRIISE